MAIRSSEEERLLRKLDKKVKKAVFDYGLVSEGDRILIGLSGGKDSLALADLLARRQRIFKPRFEVVAAHILMDNIPYHADLDYLKERMEAQGVPLILHRTCFDPASDHRKSPCFLCSWMRRKALFEIAKAEGCNKIALGHHQDDILQTLLMNLVYQGAFGTMPPRLKMDKFPMEIIRPLCLVAEHELVELACVAGYRKQVKACPYESASSRSEMKALFARLEALHPEARYSLWASMTNIQEEYLPRKQ